MQRMCLSLESDDVKDALPVKCQIEANNVEMLGEKTVIGYGFVSTANKIIYKVLRANFDI